MRFPSMVSLKTQQLTENTYQIFIFGYALLHKQDSAKLPFLNTTGTSRKREVIGFAGNNNAC